MSVEVCDHTTIGYYPSSRDGMQFHAASAFNDSGRKALPPGYPLKLNGPLVWSGSEMEAQHEQWTTYLSSEELTSIDDALRHFQSLKIHPSEINPITFPLPDSLVKRLDAISEACYNGIGFGLIHGLDPDKYTTEENTLLYAGISAHVAPERGFQDTSKSHVVCHLVHKASLQDATVKEATPAFTDGPMVFHTDLGEILSLYTLEVDSAGRGLLASSWQVYNELVTKRADIIRTLSETWVMDSYEDYSKVPPQKNPLLAYHAEKLIVQCSRYPLTGFGSYVRNPELPPVTEAQIEALNAIHFIAEQNSFALPNRKGDILYVNNMGCLHGREPLKTAEGGVGESVLSKRHRLRFWLRDPKRAWDIPPSMQNIWDRVYGANQKDGRRSEAWWLQLAGPRPDGPKPIPDTPEPKWSVNG